MWRTRFCTIFFAPEGDPPGPGPTPPAPGAPKTFSEEYVRELREENKTWRQKAQGHETAAQEATRKAEEAATNATKAIGEAKTAADQRVINAELRRLADKAGLVDPEGLKLLDTSAIKLNDAGEVVVPDKFFEDAKKAKPWLFGEPSTSNPANPPSPKPPVAKKAMEMTPEEYAAARREATSTRR